MRAREREGVEMKTERMKYRGGCNNWGLGRDGIATYGGKRY